MKDRLPEIEPLGAPRRRVLDALAHRPPERVPFSWGFCATPEMQRTLADWFAAQGVSWPVLRDLVCDRVWVGPRYTGPLPPDGNTFTGIWGIHMKTTSYGTGSYEEFTDFPLAGMEDPAELDRHPWPCADDYDYESLRGQTEEADPGLHRAVQLGGGNPFELYCWMTGLEEALINVIANPALVRAALERITGFLETRLRRSLEEAGDLVDMVFLADDLGSQTGLLMSRESYRQVLQPFHRRLTAAAHELAPGASVLLHSDGAVFDVLPDLIDAGVDCLEAVQTDAAGMEPERLKAAFGDRLAFHGALSVQQLLPRGDAASVESECRRIAEVMGRGGGYIAAPSHAIQMGTPPENVEAMLRGILGRDWYETVKAQAKGGSG